MTTGKTIALTAAAAAAKSLQSCPTLCDPMDRSLPGLSIHGILQARTLEWVAISFSNAWRWKVKVKLLSRVRHFTTPWTVAYQAPPSMGFSRQEYWSGLPFPSPTMGYYSVIKKNEIMTICSHMDATRDYHTKWNKSEREKTNTLYHLHVESKIWNKWTYLWNRNGISDMENKLVVAKRKRSERSLNWEFGISRWKLVYIE